MQCSFWELNQFQGLPHFDIKIKWPNDLFLNGLKVGGILCTSTYKSKKFNVSTGKLTPFLMWWCADILHLTMLPYTWLMDCFHSMALSFCTKYIIFSHHCLLAKLMKWFYIICIEKSHLNLFEDWTIQIQIHAMLCRYRLECW